ncbi:MAG: hypothetical protein HYV35_05700 [Lentisphaerae bacterium]|nr:hypothetical protein [Lentisphaerota bacterium]
MMSPRRWLALTVWIFFAIAVIGYLFWIPYDPARMHRAIPASAALVTVHQDLANRAPHLITNIWLNPFFNPTGISVPSPNTIPTSNLGQLVSRLMPLARHDTIIAYLPVMRDEPGTTANSTWMLASWIGPWSTCLRWALSWGHWPGVKELGECGGRTMWGLPTSGADGRQISFACGDGIFLACFSRDSTAVRYALMTHDGLLPSTRAFAELRAASLAGLGPAEPAAQDTLWCQWRGSKSPGSAGGYAEASAEPFTLTGALARFDNQGLSATFRLRPSPGCPWPSSGPSSSGSAGLRRAGGPARLADNLDIVALKQILGNLPAFVLALPLPTVQDGLRAASGTAGLQATRRILQSDWIQPDSNAVVLALFTGEYGGGYGHKPLRLSVPALMAFVRVRSPASNASRSDVGWPENVRAIIDRELDLLNAQHRLGLVQDPIPITAGAQSIWTIEITSPKIQDALEVEDRAAYTLLGDWPASSRFRQSPDAGWLIVSSQAGSLAKLTSLLKTISNETQPPSAPWHTVISASNTSGLAWLDLEAGGKPAQLALSLWGLSQRTPDSPSSPPIIKSARALLEKISPLKSGVLWLEPDGPDTIVRVEIGPPAEKL